MKAIQYGSYGGSEVLLMNNSMPDPFPKAGQVLVDVKAAGFNPFDLMLRSGAMKEHIPLTLPIVFGGDFSGMVLALGEGASGYAVGDAVFGTSIVLNGGSGSFAQETVANVTNITKKPAALSFEEAAALPLVGSSAIQALEDHIVLMKGQKILIHGGAGGIGHIAVQIAKAIGAYVIATAGTDDLAFVKSLGADEVIDYKTEHFETMVSGVDAVYDTVGGETTTRSFMVLKKGGVLVSMRSKPDEKLASEHGVTVIGQATKTDAHHLARLVHYVENGHVHVTIGGAFPMSDVVAASILAEGHVRGKVVVKIE